MFDGVSVGSGHVVIDQSLSGLLAQYNFQADQYSSVQF